MPPFLTAPVFTALASGLLFGLGLTLSGMVNPAKVLGFLDVAGAWDPSLAGVMAGAIPVTFLCYRLARRLGRPVPPASAALDGRLLGGAALFGLGWGLAGFCPGPALLAWLVEPRALIFLGAMAVGMLAHDRLLPGRAAAAPPPTSPPFSQAKE